MGLPVLFEAWGGVAGASRRPYAADVELTRLGLLAGDTDVVEACAADAVRGLAHGHRPAEAGAMGQAAIALLEQARRPLSLRLIATTAEALGTAGEGAAAEGVLARGARRAGDVSADIGPDELSRFLFALGNRQVTAGDLDAAQATFERLCGLEVTRGDEHQLAIARGRIADVLQARGELDEALRVRREEQLPVFQRLGDVRSAVATQGKIANILAQRGDYTEALTLHDERLATNRSLGSADGIAASLWDIAQTAMAQDQLVAGFDRR